MQKPLINRGALFSLILAGCAVGMTVPAAPAEAQLDRLEIRGEAGVGSMLPSYQNDVLDYDLGVELAFRPAYRFLGPFAVQLAFENWIYPRSNADGGHLLIGGGFRIEPMIGEAGRFFVDANLGVAVTGGETRFGFNVGIGFEAAVEEVFQIGPVIRYGHVAAAGDDFQSDAQTLVFALSGVLRFGAADETAPLDQDGDGITDGEDACPTEPAGETPDPDRAGCPIGDADGDGVIDEEDACPDQPAGDTPDPERAGCPAGDSDGDGVLDPNDLCADAPAGETPDPNRAGCPAGDRDGDGVSDPDDRCPETNQGPFPDGDRPGCPQPDSDGDSVPDGADACPEEAGAPHPEPERNGCPGLVQVDQGQIRINTPVFFASGSDRILSRSNAVLQAVADALRASPQIRKVSIEGHTDDQGNDASNLQLSERRANRVMQWLTEEGSIDASRLEARGFGETRPLVEGRTRQARSQNRRVEFRIVDPPQEGDQAPEVASEEPSEEPAEDPEEKQ
ncbi:MAG: OmpA family protein [Myxococcota bacterium]